MERFLLASGAVVREREAALAARATRAPAT
jgi:hypothetical protein